MIERLERIERLRDERASRRAIVCEVGKLLDEAEAWLAAEPGGTERARDALDRCRSSREPGGEAAPATR